MVARALGLVPELDWLPDDTEETISGTSTHRAVIVGLHNLLAHVRYMSRLPWFIGNQMPFLIPRQSGGTYQPALDIMVHPSLGMAYLPAISVLQHGLSALAIEITSPETAREHDLNTLELRMAYTQAGIPEYLAYDPTGSVLPERVRAWRMGTVGEYAPWKAEADGRWHSALGISFAPEAGGVLLRVYDQNGQLVPTPLELAAQIAAQQEEAAVREARIAELEAELRRQGEN